MDYIWSKQRLSDRIRYLRREIDRLPQGCCITSHGVVHVRIKNGNTFRQYSTRKDEGKAYYEQICKRNKMIGELQSLEAEWKERFGGDELLEPKPRTPSILWTITSIYYDSLQNCANNYYTNKAYMFKGMRMRSKNEVIFAGVLDSLNLDFKYEPIIQLNGRAVSPDFAVNVPERGNCMYFEIVGMVDDPKYRESFYKKLDAYLEAGFIPGEDVFFLFFNSKNIPDTAALVSRVVCAVEQR